MTMLHLLHVCMHEVHLRLMVTLKRGGKNRVSIGCCDEGDFAAGGLDFKAGPGWGK